MAAQITKSIESLCLRVTSGGTPSRNIERYWSNGTISWFKTGELKDCWLEESEEKITEEALENSAAKIFPPNTVLMAMYGDGRTITSLGILRNPAATNQACCAMIADPAQCDYRFLFYKLQDVRSALLKLVVAGAQRNLSAGIIKNFSIDVPPIHTQVEIVEILSAYDDLIENNRRRIVLLEESAWMLYREWFIYFRFPGHEHVKIIDGIPEGWTRQALGSVLNLQRGFDLPVGERVAGSVPVYGSTGPVGEHNVPKVTFPTLITGRSGSLGAVCFVDDPCWPLNTSLWVTEFKAVSIYYAYFMLTEMNLAKFNGGASVPTLDRKVAHAAKVLVPNQSLANLFDEHAQDLFAQKKVLQQQNKKLAQARDILLPRLMKGEIAI